MGEDLVWTEGIRPFFSKGGSNGGTLKRYRIGGIMWKIEGDFMGSGFCGMHG